MKTFKWFFVRLILSEDERSLIYQAMMSGVKYMKGAAIYSMDYESAQRASDDADTGYEIAKAIYPDADFDVVDPSKDLNIKHFLR